MKTSLSPEDRISSLPDPPRHYFKYKFIDEDHPEYSSRIFTHNELYFSTVNEFNDPFDCQFQVEFSGSGYDKAKFIDELLKQGSPHLARQERRLRARENSKFLSDPHMANTMRDRIRQEIEEWGICCLSEVRDNILMWSHYANKHQGFCLEFARGGSDALFGVEIWLGGQIQKRDIVAPFRVEYSTEYPVANLVSGEIAKETLLIKAKQWEYEKEWRMMIPDGRGTHQFPPQCLTGVIFGCRMSEKHKELIRDWCKDRDSAIKYYQARQSVDSYRLHIEEIL